MDLKEAKEAGAIAMFGEKYDSEARHPLHVHLHLGCVGQYSKISTLCQCWLLSLSRL